MQKLIEFLEQKGLNKEAKNLEEDNTTLKLEFQGVHIDTVIFIFN